MSDQQASRGLGRQDVTAVSRPRSGAGRADETAVIPVIRDEQGDRSAAAGKASTDAAPTAKAGASREARLRLVRLDPWSVVKTVFTLSVALMIVAVVAMTVLWSVLSIAGVWDQVNSTVTAVLSDDSGSFDIKDYLGFGRLVGLTLVISAINVLISTAVAAIAAHLYNLAAQLLGGITVTLAEDA
ncbi:DUF3566 domain-containing protein [Aeromicrobium sp. IC_218]|uniref:DUF3566 domain-containing protein n=1 Tax=Aeromicrobium sp. IC_218 TaxID=2545468 RepID=UPI00103C96DE|nr:DUF3566 domain-containing protein [Aeromicrobium sp. IC_218]TCJ00550.1 DUF3566 domain-containing protein [Aeromicrobium sp. IC_218]